MKAVLAVVLGLVMTVAAVTPAAAAPFKAADKNPNVLDYYETGPHGIVGEPYYHEGQDLVMKAGKSGNIQQWFYGYSEEDGGIIEGDHSVWKLSKDGSCEDGWILVADAYPDWGLYLEPGADYCVKTNDFRSPGHSSP